VTSLRRQLTVRIVGVVAAVLVALALLLYFVVSRAAWRQHDAGLVARAKALAAIVEHDEDGYEVDMPNDVRGYVEIWTEDGVLARSKNLTTDLPRGAALADITLPDGRAGRAVTYHFHAHEEARTAAGPVTLVLAESTEDVTATLGEVQRWFLVLGAFAVGAVALVTAWSLGRGLLPLRDLALQLEAIDDRTLATRLTSTHHPAELQAPVKKLDELLGRLDGSFARERQFTADVSHELRTPLAGLRTLLEVTALTDRSASEYKAAVAEALAVVGQLGALVESLLALARLDAGKVEVAETEVSLGMLVDECWKPYAEVATARGVAFRNRIAADLVVRTDREKLRIAVGNLLSNAAEYTDAGGWIEVASGDALLDVTDSGPPLPDDERVFDRLWRGDAARSGTGVHCGIGLALARASCRAIGKDLVARSLPDGSVRFRIQ
jgi:signal transduction histidine kinase